MLAIVVTHQGRAWLKDCLVALNAQTYADLDVLVVDDASPDHRQQPHLKRVVKRHLRARRWGFLRTRRPLGFGGAINWALSRVRTDADLLLFIHDDAALDPGSVERMVERMQRDETTAIVGPKIVAWDDSQALEEVGMAIDRFGYPYKGLERGEIDLGQHDSETEVFYVTSTCMLMRHEVFRELRGWDARMRAFSEDLDLCWRARVAGHDVAVEPRARARHAIALATGRRRSRFTPTRYYIRRNRLRTVAKNVSSLRLVALIPQFVLLSFTEMLAFIVLRQPAEIGNLVKALGWNLFTSPQTLSERLRVQRTRKVADRRLRRLTVRESTRVRAYVSNQAERLEDAWGRGTELVAQRSIAARRMSRSFGGWPLAAAAVALVALALGFRHYLLAPPVTVGELLPYPERATALWRSFFSPWHGAGLGHPGPTSPALLLLGAVPPLAFGAVGLAQKVLIAVLGTVAFIGAYRLISEVVDPPARLVCGAVYVLGAVGFAGMRQGALSALAFGAAAPFVLHAILSTTGWIRPPGWGGARGVARVALGGALSAAFVPGSLILFGGVVLISSALRLLLGPRAKVPAGLLAALGGLVVAWLLLLPWSATWWEPGGVLAELAGDATWRAHAADFNGHGMVSVLLGRTPAVPAPLGLGTASLALIALALAEGQRRKLALVLVATVVGCGWFVSATAAGSVRPVVASPVEAGVLAAIAFAGLAGLAVGAFRLDLRRRRLGWVHALSIAGLGAPSALFLAGLLPALWAGAWMPGRAVASADPAVIAQVRSVLGAESDREGQFRVLWIGAEWSGRTGTTPQPGPSTQLVTGPTGQTLSSLFARRGGPGEAALERAIDSVESGSTDVGGRALGPFNVRYIVLDRAPGASRWLAQRDLAVIRTEPSYLLLENRAELPRAALLAEPPRSLETPGAGAEPSGAAARRLSASRYVIEAVAGPGVAWLSETSDARWSASVAGRELARIDRGWGNAFEVPAEARGELTIAYPRSTGEVVVLLGLALGWIVVVGAAFARPERPAGPVGGP